MEILNAFFKKKGFLGQFFSVFNAEKGSILHSHRQCRQSEECVIEITAGSVLGTERKFCKIRLSRRYSGEKEEYLLGQNTEYSMCPFFNRR